MSGIIGTSHSKSKVIGKSRDTAKVWVHFNGPAETVDDSYNVSSVSEIATGVYQVSFKENLANATYAVVSGDYYWGIGLENNMTTSSIRTTRRTNGDGGASQATSNVSLIVFGS